jgi:ankyrin repeat protein
MLAAYAGQLGAVKELRHYGAKYELQDKGGSSALHWAMDGANLELIEWMLDDGADIMCKDYNHWTPLLRVCES